MHERADPMYRNLDMNPLKFLMDFALFACSQNKSRMTLSACCIIQNQPGLPKISTTRVLISILQRKHKAADSHWEAVNRLIEEALINQLFSY